jgi:hypothetical protein
VRLRWIATRALNTLNHNSVGIKDHVSSVGTGGSPTFTSLASLIAQLLAFGPSTFL